MGNKQSSEEGVLITFNKPFFYSGEMISGNLYLNLGLSHAISDISITLIGKEETSWIPNNVTYEEKINVLSNPRHLTTKENL